MNARKVKIVATLGPASTSSTILQAMVEAGMNVARLNCSHATHDDLESRISQVRRLSTEMDRPLGILLDLAGPKLRIGELQGGSVELREGASITIGADRGPGTAERLGCTHAGLAADVAPGARILLDDGHLELRVAEIRGDEVVCSVVVGGLLEPRKGLNLPDTQLQLPSLTAKDAGDLEVGVRLGVDYVALSFVQSARDLLDVRRLLEAHRASIPVIAKIERPQAVDNLLEILEVSDGVMVARGDLGVEAGSHRVPMIQKRILAEASRRAVTDITATQMLDSMIRNPRPTRAEASDVANAILDGTDAVMLSGETAVGRYPVESVAMMDRISREVERETLDLPAPALEDDFLRDEPGAAVARAACLIARDAAYRAIIVLTESGLTARTVAACRPRATVLALTPRIETWRRLTLVRGVNPVFLPFEGGTDAILAAGEMELRRRGLLASGDRAILVSGQLDSWGVTHLLKLFRARDDSGSSIQDLPRMATLTRPISLRDLEE